MRQLTLTAVAVWLGAMGFFAFIAAPAAFGALDRDAAGRFVSAVFPRYYGVGLALGLVACFGLGFRWMGGAWRGAGRYCGRRRPARPSGGGRGRQGGGLCSTRPSRTTGCGAD